MLRQLKRVILDAADIVLPRQCAVCGATLGGGEPHICPACMTGLPRTFMHERHFNAMEQLFAGKTPIERATAFFYYERGSRYAAILHSLKYHNNPRIGEWLAARFANEISPSGFFDGIDAVVPVPLHFTKRATRGYNQSEYIAKGIGRAAGIPVVRALVATKPHPTQTRKGVYERMLNTQGIFALSAKHNLEGKHILLTDDVVTTGATLLACAELINAAVPGVKISAATLAAARLA